MDTRFSVAVHVLILISESPEPMDSEKMARSVGTNASYIRKVLGSLKKADIVSSRRGSPGSPCWSPRKSSRCCGCIKP